MKLLLTLTVWGWLGFQYGKGEITGFYFTLYFLLGLAVVAYEAVALFADFGRRGRNSESLIGRMLFLFEEAPYRFLSFGYVPLFVWGAVTILVAVVVAGAGVSFYDPVLTGNPYQANAGLSQDGLSQYGFAQNLVLGAVIPGLFEEGVTLMGVSATAGLLLLGIGALFRNPRLASSPVLYWLAVIPSLALWAFLFAVAHGRYAGNQPQLVYAFTFEFVVQLLNFATGSFVSWLPHIVHNAVVIADVQYSIGLLSALAAPVAAGFVLPARPRAPEATKYE